MSRMRKSLLVARQHVKGGYDSSGPYWRKQPWKISSLSSGLIYTPVCLLSVSVCQNAPRAGAHIQPMKTVLNYLGRHWDESKNDPVGGICISTISGLLLMALSFVISRQHTLEFHLEIQPQRQTRVVKMEPPKVITTQDSRGNSHGPSDQMRLASDSRHVPEDFKECRSAVYLFDHLQLLLD